MRPASGDTATDDRLKPGERLVGSVFTDRGVYKLGERVRVAYDGSGTASTVTVDYTIGGGSATAGAAFAGVAFAAGFATGLGA